KCKQSPGGNSSFAFGWSDNTQTTPRKQRSRSKVKYNIINYETDPYNQDDLPKQATPSIKTAGYTKSQFNLSGDYTANDKVHSLKVTAAPGGRSNIVFGNDSTNYEDYRRRK